MPGCILGRVDFLPDHRGDEVLLTKDFAHQDAQVVDLMIVNTDENHPIIPQQVARQSEPRIHHVQPVRVVPPTRLSVRHQHASYLVGLTGRPQVLVYRLGEVIAVDEVVARVVGRIDVDHLHATGVAFLQQL